MVTTTRYIYDGNQYLAEADETDTINRLYTNELDAHTHLISQEEVFTGDTLTYHYDAIGSTRSVTDETEAVTDEFTYDAWGNRLSRTGTNDIPFQYVGEHGYYREDATDSYYVMARTYQPSIGRWWSMDPLGFVDGLNLHYYVINMPVGAIDPSGFEKLIKYFSRYKDQVWNREWDKSSKVPQITPYYEVVFQEVTLTLDGSTCEEIEDCGGESNCKGSANVSISVTTTNSSIGINTRQVPNAGIFDPVKKVFAPSKKLDDDTGKKGNVYIGAMYLSEISPLKEINCTDSVDQKVYYTLPGAKAGAVDGTHHEISITVTPTKKCGEFKLGLSMKLVDPKMSARQGKHLMELKGPNDPNRPPFGAIGQKPPE